MHFLKCTHYHLIIYEENLYQSVKSLISIFDTPQNINFLKIDVKIVLVSIVNSKSALRFIFLIHP